jgi:hypothetical protein
VNALVLLSVGVAWPRNSVFENRSCFMGGVSLIFATLLHVLQVFASHAMRRRLPHLFRILFFMPATLFHLPLMPTRRACLVLLRVLLGVQLLLALGLPLHGHAHHAAEVAAVGDPGAAEDPHEAPAPACTDCPLCRLGATPALIAGVPACPGPDFAAAPPSPDVACPGCANLRIDPYASRDPPV